jgi:hypothetical protein
MRNDEDSNHLLPRKSILWRRAVPGILADIKLLWNGFTLAAIGRFPGLWSAFILPVMDMGQISMSHHPHGSSQWGLPIRLAC